MNVRLLRKQKEKLKSVLKQDRQGVQNKLKC